MRVKVQTPYELAYQTHGSCAFDFQANETVTFAPWEYRLIDTGTVIEVPEGYVLQISPRSSTFKNFWLIQVNGVGIIDQDYCGDNDIIKFPYLNMRSEPVIIEKGTRIWQGMFLKIEQAQFMNKADRGGFGSTGQK